MNNGQVIATIGLALCMIGLYKTGTAASGVLAEDGKKFSKVLVLSVLPATQGIYGFVLAIMKSSAIASITTTVAGWQVFAGAAALSITGMVSALLQAKTAVAAIMAVSKNESISGKLILFPAMVETYAILALVISIML